MQAAAQQDIAQIQLKFGNQDQDLNEVLNEMKLEGIDTQAKSGIPVSFAESGRH